MRQRLALWVGATVLLAYAGNWALRLKAEPSVLNSFGVVLHADATLRISTAAGETIRLKSSVRQGGTEIERSQFVERVTAAHQDFEHTWTFPRRPSAAGALEVRVDVLNGGAVSRIGNGLKLTSSTGMQSVFYGPATWVDARGQRTALQAELRNGTQWFWRLPEGLLDRSVYPAVLDPIISAEVPLGPSTGLAVPPGHQTRPWVAAGNSTYMVVWHDDRVTFGPVIVGARIQADGTVLDPSGIIIASRSNPHGSPQVAFDGVNFVVVWDEKRGADLGIYGARVALNGTVLDPDGFLINDTPGDQAQPSIAFGSNVTMVAWATGAADNHDIVTVRLAPGATSPTDANPIVVCNRTNDQFEPMVAAGGGVFYVVWSHQRAVDQRGIFGAVVTAQGVVQNPNGNVVTNMSDADEPHAVFTGSEFIVGWSEWRNPWPAYNDIYAARVSTAGTVITPNGVPVWEEDGQDFLSSVGFDGTNILLNRFKEDRVPMKFYDIVTTRITPALAVVGNPRIVLYSPAFSDVSYTPRVAFVNGTGLFAFEAGNSSEARLNLFFTLLAQGAETPTGPATVLSQRAPAQDVVASAFNGVQYLTVWREGAMAGTSLYGRFVGAGGSLSGSKFLIASNAATDVSALPAVATDGTDFLVAWSNWDEIAMTGTLRATKVRNDGTVETPSGVVVVSGPGRRASPRMVFDGLQYFLVWRDERSGNSDVYGAHLDLSGAPIESGGVGIDLGGAPKEHPVVTKSQGATLVAWSESTSDAGNKDIVARWVAIDGGITAGARTVLSSVVSDSSAVEVSAQPSTFFAVWNDRRTGSERTFGTRLHPSGGVVDPQGIQLSANGTKTLPPVVVSEGNQFHVVWPQASPQQRWDLYGVSVELDGGLAPNGAATTRQYLIVDAPVQALAPYLSAGPAGEVLVAYSQFLPESGKGTSQVMARLLNPGPSPEVDGGPSDGGPSDGGPDTGVAVRHLTVRCGCQSAPPLPMLAALFGSYLSFKRRRRTGARD